MRRAVGRWTAGAGVGAVLWTLTEYAMHRWLMHGPLARRNPLGAEHRAHHVDPAATSAPGRALAYAALGVVAGSAAAAGGGPGALGGAAGWLAGFALYEQFHWREHHRAPLGSWERRARQRHAVHHGSQPRANFGVTTAVWDRIFGTFQPSEVPPAVTVRGGVILRAA